jgi:hypothetical protein
MSPAEQHAQKNDRDCRLGCHAAQPVELLRFSGGIDRPKQNAHSFQAPVVRHMPCGGHMAYLRKWFLATSALLAQASAVFATGDRVPPRPPLHIKGVVVTSRHGVPVLMIPPPEAVKASVPRASAPSVHDSGATFDNLDRKYHNAEFLSWYGFSDLASTASSCTGSRCDIWTTLTENAIPIRGAGQAVTTIEVPIYSDDSSYKFNVAIYDSAGGLPANELAGASTSGASTYDCCSSLRTVKIRSTTLKKGKEYFVVVSPVGQAEGLWLTEDTDFEADEKDYSLLLETIQSCTSKRKNCSTNYYQSGWQPSGLYPAEPAAVVK